MRFPSLRPVTFPTAALCSMALLAGCASSSGRLVTMVDSVVEKTVDNMVETARTPSAFVLSSLKPSGIPRNAREIEDLRLDTEVCLTKAAISTAERDRQHYLRHARESVTTLQWVSPGRQDIELLNRRLSRLETSTLITEARQAAP